MVLRSNDGFIEGWDDYFAEIAMTVARKSKDPKCKVGCVVTSEDNLIVSTGFNGFPRGVHDSQQLLNDVDQKLVWVCHAEANAILNAARSGVALKGCTIYVTKFPCFNCCQLIVQSGIGAIYTRDSRYWDDDPADKESHHGRKRSLLAQSGIRVTAPNHPEYGGGGADSRGDADAGRKGPRAVKTNGRRLQDTDDLPLLHERKAGRHG